MRRLLLVVMIALVLAAICGFGQPLRVLRGCRPTVVVEVPMADDAGVGNVGGLWRVG